MAKQQDDNLNLRELQQQLQQALALIEQNNISKTLSTSEDAQGLGNTQSLLQRCEQVVQQGQKQQKPVLRIVHHFACSGGTLVSKCIAAQPNVFLLSELHPTTRLGLPKDKAAYTPHDIVAQAIYGKVPDVDNLAEKLFVQNIIETEKHIRELGGYLVLRAHTHADFCTDAKVPEVDSVTRLLAPHFDIKQLVTVRNPIDSFLSLKTNGWVHFEPRNFDEYCRRLSHFLSGFSDEIIVKYEDFVEKPERVLKIFLQMLELPSVDHGLNYIDVFKISGDSGRSGIDILPRLRKEVTSEFTLEINSSNSFAEIRRKYKF